MAVMTSAELVKKAQAIVDNYNTVYMWGTFGMPVTAALITQKTRQYPSYYPSATQTALKALVGKNYFGIDCVGLIKGILWGWSGDSSKANGGAGYGVNGVPDINANAMINVCNGVSADFSNIVPGEAVWLTGHIGIYIGDGKVIESTPSWKNGVQVTACANVKTISGLNSRKWTKHGKLPYVDYSSSGSGNSGGTSTQTGQEAPTSVSKGDTVEFTGGAVYASSAGITAAATKPASTCTVTGVAAAAKHPYHLISKDGKGVYGWVDVANVKGAGAALGLAVGRKVSYSGTVYADSLGNGPGRTVSGDYLVTQYIPGKKCGVHIGAVGWVPETAVSVIG